MQSKNNQRCCDQLVRRGHAAVRKSFSSINARCRFTTIMHLNHVNNQLSKLITLLLQNTSSLRWCWLWNVICADMYLIGVGDALKSGVLPCDRHRDFYTALYGLTCMAFQMVQATLITTVCIIPCKTADKPVSKLCVLRGICLRVHSYISRFTSNDLLPFFSISSMNYRLRF